MPPTTDDLPSSPAAIPSNLAAVDAVADERKRRAVDAIPEGARFATRDEVRAMIDAASGDALTAQTLGKVGVPSLHALQGIEAAARLQALTSLAGLALCIVGAAIVMWKLRD